MTLEQVVSIRKLLFQVDVQAEGVGQTQAGGVRQTQTNVQPSWAWAGTGI